jgi:hypothetical protein
MQDYIVQLRRCHATLPQYCTHVHHCDTFQTLQPLQRLSDSTVRKLLVVLQNGHAFNVRRYLLIEHGAPRCLGLELRICGIPEYRHCLEAPLQRNPSHNAKQISYCLISLVFSTVGITFGSSRPVKIEYVTCT